MTTRLRDDSTVTREVEFIDERGKTNVYIVTIAREGVYMREKGKRKTFGAVPWARVCWEAVKATDGMPTIPGPPAKRGGAGAVRGSRSATRRVARNLLSL